jgi:anaerobic magnesium-protoporphyrin IX monomethyl ester cyclase
MRERKMKTKGFFIVGLPGETMEQINRTLDFAENLGLGWVGITIATPLPGSELYDKCVAEGYINPDTINFNELKYGYAQVNTAEFTAEEIQKLVYEANLRLNFFNNYNMRVGNYEEAITDFERVVHLYPNHIIARLRLGDAYQAVGRGGEAEEQWRKVLEISPENKEAMERIKALK